jgi:hypothetical protein
MFLPLLMTTEVNPIAKDSVIVIQVSIRGTSLNQVEALIYFEKFTLISNKL